MKKIILLIIVLSAIVACTNKPNAHAEFHVRGNCDMCKDRIDKTALSLKGVSDAAWDLENSLINVTYDSTIITSAEIEKAIAATGHATKNVPMDSIAHNSLPECCQVHGKEMH